MDWSVRNIIYFVSLLVVGVWMLIHSMILWGMGHGLVMFVMIMIGCIICSTPVFILYLLYRGTKKTRKTHRGIILPACAATIFLVFCIIELYYFDLIKIDCGTEWIASMRDIMVQIVIGLFVFSGLNSFLKHAQDDLKRLVVRMYQSSFQIDFLKGILKDDDKKYDYDIESIVKDGMIATRNSYIENFFNDLRMHSYFWFVLTIAAMAAVLFSMVVPEALVIVVIIATFIIMSFTFFLFKLMRIIFNPDVDNILSKLETMNASAEKSEKSRLNKLLEHVKT